jgi:hypothetical protein
MRLDGTWVKSRTPPEVGTSRQVGGNDTPGTDKSHLLKTRYFLARGCRNPLPCPDYFFNVS